MNVFLLISIIIITIVLLIVNVYLLAIYIHPDDKGFGTSILPKILVVLGLTLAWGQVFMVPLDVANSRGEGGGLDMDLFWKIILMMDAILLIILIPFAYFRYEGDEEAGFFKRTWSAICYTIATFIFFALLIGITYAFWKTARIPITTYTFDMTTSTSSSTTATSWATLSANTAPNETYLEMDVSFVVYVMAFFTLVGWFFFVFFGGAGLFAIPLDFIYAFTGRPKKRTQRELNQTKEELQRTAGELYEVGQALKSAQASAASEDAGFFSKKKIESKLGRDRNKFRAAVMTFEKEFQAYKIEKDYYKQNPIIPFLKLLAGICCMVISIIWWIQILIHCVIRIDGFPAASFLNKMLVGLQDKSAAGFVATAIFAFLAIYLIWAVTKGNVKFGLKIPFLFTLHPMIPNETLMNSFLFNVWLIIVSSIACVQFVTNAFSDYVRLTTVDMLFGIQIKYLKFYNWFYKNNVFEIAFLVWSGLCLLYLLACGRKKPKQLQELDKLKREIRSGKK